MISRLEEETGSQLFERDNRAVVLTKDGKIFAEFARNCLDNWEDLQADVGNILGVSQHLSLEKVLNATNMEFKGTAHRALDDAENTARIYVLTTNKEETKRVLGSLVELFMPKEDLSFSMGSLFDGFECKTA